MHTLTKILYIQQWIVPQMEYSYMKWYTSFNRALCPSIPACVNNNYKYLHVMYIIPSLLLSIVFRIADWVLKPFAVPVPEVRHNSYRRGLYDNNNLQYHLRHNNLNDRSCYFTFVEFAHTIDKQKRGHRWICRGEAVPVALYGHICTLWPYVLHSLHGNDAVISKAFIAIDIITVPSLLLAESAFSLPEVG